MHRIYVDLDDTLEQFADNLRFVLMELGVRMEKYPEPGKSETMIYEFEKAEVISPENDNGYL